MAQTHKNITLLKLVSFFMGMSFFTPVLSLFFLSKGVSLAQIIFSQTAYSVLIVVSEMPTGVLADKFGQKTSVFFGCLFNVAAFASFLFVPSIVGLYLGYVLFGLGDALLSGSTEALTHESSEKGAYRRNWSRIAAFDPLGAAVGSACAGLVYWVYGSRGFVPLLLLGMAAKFVGMCATTLIHTQASGVQTTSQDAQLHSILRSAVTQIRRNPTLRNLTYVKLLTLSAQYVLYSVYQPYFKEHMVSGLFVGLVITIGSLTNGLVLRLVERFEKVISLNSAVLSFPILMAVTYSVFSLTRNPWALVLVFVFLQAQFNLLDPMISDYINEEAEPATRASVISGISFIRSIGNVLSKLMLALAISFVGITGMLRVQAMYLVFGAVLSWWLLKRCGCVYVLNDKRQAVE